MISGEEPLLRRPTILGEVNLTSNEDIPLDAFELEIDDGDACPSHRNRAQRADIDYSMVFHNPVAELEDGEQSSVSDVPIQDNEEGSLTELAPTVTTCTDTQPHNFHTESEHDDTHSAEHSQVQESRGHEALNPQQPNIERSQSEGDLAALTDCVFPEQDLTTFTGNANFHTFIPTRSQSLPNVSHVFVKVHDHIYAIPNWPPTDGDEAQPYINYIPIYSYAYAHVQPFPKHPQTDRGLDGSLSLPPRTIPRFRIQPLSFRQDEGKNSGTYSWITTPTRPLESAASHTTPQGAQLGTHAKAANGPKYEEVTLSGKQTVQDEGSATPTATVFQDATPARFQNKVTAPENLDDHTSNICPEESRYMPLIIDRNHRRTHSYENARPHAAEDVNRQPEAIAVAAENTCNNITTPLLSQEQQEEEMFDHLEPKDGPQSE